MDEEIKLFYSSIELDKIDINSPPLYSFKNFIKNISTDVPDIFIKFYNFISNTTPFKIINVKSDHGTEYINEKFN